jgi:curved DNA-binding protein CbpA
MMNPYLVLGLPETASGEEIRKAYLSKIQESTPEKDPDGFQRARDAYAALDSDEKRAELKLFGPKGMKWRPEDIVSLMPEQSLKRRKLGVELWLKMNRENI